MPRSLNEEVQITADDFRGDVLAISFLFAVPSDQVPFLIGFKQNNLEQLSAPVSTNNTTS